ncbi:hypothetical protein ACMDCR_08970 [Labrys okinawensis]|uniref:hypothetical protein n=1 Tax=Labrys okinawensis TaxID=346911 RepID=UPI0039BD748A
MRSTFFRLCLIGAMAWPAGIVAARAEDAPSKPPAPPAPSQPIAPDNSILAFIAANPDCSELTDECIICAVVSGKAMCSTPGISCVKKEVRCTSTKPPTPKQ